MSKYKKIYSLECAKYIEGAPVYVSAGAIFLNTDNEKLHAQIKFCNLSFGVICMLKVRLTLLDAIDRKIDECEAQYFDLEAKRGEFFGSKKPIIINNPAVRKFDVCITEVCFTNRTVWANEKELESIPMQKSLTGWIKSAEAREEYKSELCKEAKFQPIEYKDIFICACGHISKKEEGLCVHCGAKFNDILVVDEESLRNENIYKKAIIYSSSNDEAKTSLAISMFDKIIEYKDSSQKKRIAEQSLEQIRQDLRLKKEEKDSLNKKIKKTVKIASIIAVALLIAIITPISVIKYINTTSTNGCVLEKVGKNYVVVGYDGESDNVVIPPKYKLRPVVAIKKEAFVGANVSEIVVPSTVKEIELGAFSGCENLTQITLPFIGANSEADDTTCFGYIFGTENVFNNAEKVPTTLKTVVITGETILNSYSFYECDMIERVTLPEGITTIPYNAFANCSNLKRVTIPNSVTGINELAFLNCHDIESIVLPQGLNSIRNKAFANCFKLRNIVIPESVTVMGANVFSGCDDNLTIFCEASSQPNGWDSMWNMSQYNKFEVVWAE